MKIDPGLKHVALPSAVENRPGQPPATARAETEQTAVSLSQRAAQVTQLESRLAEIPVIDRARVDSIKAAIAGGQYTIKPENIAESLINSVKEMLHVAR